jgi:hypothetical protein
LYDGYLSTPEHIPKFRTFWYFLWNCNSQKAQTFGIDLTRVLFHLESYMPSPSRSPVERLPRKQRHTQRIITSGNRQHRPSLRPAIATARTPNQRSSSLVHFWANQGDKRKTLTSQQEEDPEEHVNRNSGYGSLLDEVQTQHVIFDIDDASLFVFTYWHG